VTESEDAATRSWIEVPADHHFSLQNLPYGVMRPGAGAAPRAAVAIGDRAVDLAVLGEVGLLSGLGVDAQTFAAPCLNPFMALGRPAWRRMRERLTHLLHEDCPELRDNPAVRDAAVLPRNRVEMLLPAAVGDYTDFYSSREHATNVGTMFRGRDNALQPNWLHLPVGYHGRAGSLVVSGTDVRRPYGQTRPDDAKPPLFGPSRLMDFELEVGFLVGPPSTLGAPIPVERAFDHIFGLVLVNDWSARDIQRWEYVPLGPFLGKNFATSVSPWVVTLEALEPFRRPGPTQEPRPLPYLRTSGEWAYDIHLEVWLQSERMEAPARIVRSNFSFLYWSVCQQLAHHTVNGCNVRTGDLMASGTISGPDSSSWGSMLELTWKGTKPLSLPNGEERRFLEDGDLVTMKGWSQGEGYRVGFGEVSGRLLPAAPNR
jgi:fumarylacetoacetase